MRSAHLVRDPAAAEALLDGVPALWVRPGALRAHLGGSHGAVVLDLTEGFDADALGAAAGLVVEGGGLVVVLPRTAPVALAIAPYGAEDVGRAMEARLEAPPGGGFDARLQFAGTAEQAALVGRLREALAGPPSRRAVLADRGRGKSAALGMAVAGYGAVVTAAYRDQAAEVLRFAEDARFVDPLELARGSDAAVVVVDEAAGLAVPLLRAILHAHPEAHVLFASTVHGYEGTGRGFALRFLPGVEGLVVDRLTVPIRWEPGDPLEAWTHRVLLLDAEPGGLSARPGPGPVPRSGDAGRGEAVHVRAAPAGVSVRPIVPAALEEPALRQLFGLLVAAHYRTTPSDLHRLLDAPNLHTLALFAGQTLGGACVVAEEGGLSAEHVDALARGARRIRGHALAETLIVHAGRPEAGALRMIRSVRTAVHPDARRLGWGRALVEAVHGRFAPDLFGTLFGATPELLRFRRSLGYRLVRVGIARSSRSGEPSVGMVHPVSPAARALTDGIRAELARDLPWQLTLMERDGLGLSAAMRDALLADLPDPAPLDAAELTRILGTYLDGPRPFDLVAGPVRAWVERVGLAGLSAARLVEDRVIAGRSWVSTAERAGLPVPGAMRQLRRALRELRDRGNGPGT